MPINIVAVIACAVINMIIGSLWYSPLLFAKPWMKLVGKKENDLRQGNMSVIYGVAFVSSLVMAYVLAMMIYYTGSRSVVSGMQTAFLLWLGFVATSSMMNDLFEGRSMKLFAVNVGYFLVALLVMGAVLAVWQ